MGRDRQINPAITAYWFRRDKYPQVKYDFALPNDEIPRAREFFEEIGPAAKP
jgi:hypothetical protein